MKTYASRCHLQQEKCRGHKVRMIHKGRCPSSQSPCAEARQGAMMAMKKRQLLNLGFVPRCNPDGSFNAVQCMKTASVCWCVDNIGKEISGTRTRNGSPVCPSPSPRGSGRPHWKQRRMNYKGCPKNVRVTFNKKVIGLLERQFIAYMTGKSASARIQGIGKVHTLMWKFNQLDKNANYFLDFRELHDLLRTTKKTIYPKKCSKTFVVYCDENADNRLSRNEWYACFGVQEIKKCIGEYLTAVKLSQHSPSGSHFLPKCQSDGSYYPTQCHPAIGYCWCADVDTGKPIPGSTEKTSSLDCRKYGNRRGGSSPRKKGGRKECTREILPTFARQLLQLFRKEVTAKQIDDKALVGDMDESLIRIQRKARSGHLNLWGAFLSNNQVLAWKFHQLDANNNRLLTSSEYFVSKMKKALGKIKRGRRCSRKLLNECDFDKNGGLSVGEWSYCLLNKFLRTR
ncbi:SPARC-related modular calcium-binding protein 1 [Exaiptasia diaphana]|nr:SPARC-related modular calcium-binding protein 1 [Exaiptasia diaphana]